MDQVASPSLRNIGPLLVGPEASVFSRTLVRDHLDPSTQLALHGVARGARDLVLSTAKRVVVTIKLDPSAESGQQYAMVSSVVAALKTRGQLPSKVKLQLHATRHVKVWPLIMALATLKEASAHVHELELDYSDTLPTSALITAGQCCPSLTALTVTGSIQAMPAPSHLPYLVQLGIKGQLDSTQHRKRVCRSCAPYLPHLTHLHLQPIFFEDSIPFLLNPTSASTTLCTLSINTMMDDRLLGLLLEHAPALEVLSVAAVDHAGSNAYRQHPCQWRSLTCTGRLSLTSLSYLPLPAGLTITVPRHERMVCNIDTAEEEATVLATMARAKDVTFNVCTLWLNGGVWDDPEPEPAALRMSFNVMRAIPNLTPGVKVKFSYWTMSAALMRELRGLPKLGILELDDVEWLSTMFYEPLLRLIPSSYQEVEVSSSFAPLREAQLRGLCLGAPIDRTAEHPFTIRVSQTYNVQPIQQWMQESGLYPHVTIE